MLRRIHLQYINLSPKPFDFLFQMNEQVRLVFILHRLILALFSELRPLGDNRAHQQNKPFEQSKSFHERLITFDECEADGH